MVEKKLILVVIILIVTLLPLFAAGQDESSESSSPGVAILDMDPEEIKGEITFWFHQPLYKEMMEEFNNYYPNLTMSYVPVNNNDYVTKFISAATAGTALPDIAAMEMSHRGSIINLDLWENLEAPPYNLDRSDLVDFIVPLSVNDKDQIVGVEVSPSPSGLAYKRDLALKYFGTDDPGELEKILKDWKSFEKAGIEVRNKSNGSVYMMAGINDLALVVEGQNQIPLIADKKIVGIDYYEGKFKLLKSFRDAGIIDTMDTWSSAWNASYTKKNHIFYPCTTWSPQYIIEPNDPEGSGNWGIIAAPEGGYNWGGTLLAIPKKATNKEGAWAYINWLLLTEEGQVAWKEAGANGPYKKINNDPDFYNTPSEYWGGQSPLSTLISFSDDIVVRPLTKYDNTVSNALVIAHNKLNTGESVQTAIDSMVTNILSKHPELSK